jgi:CHAT domain-containing protein
VKKLVISPDGPLALLPFETLLVENKALIAKYDVSYVQSLSVLSLLRDRQREYAPIKRKDLFAMGAPIYELETASPSVRKSRTRTSGINRTIAPGDPNQSRAAAYSEILQAKFTNLPGTESEIRGVAKLFSDPSIHIKGDATEARLIELNKTKELANYRYLLFSAHGYLNTEVPELSALVLGQVDKMPNTDGFITAAKWPAYNLRSDLIVLSACETGVGKNVLGEGIMGLPYSLYIAGNQSTALSLWAVDDAGTALFMKTFFGYLKAGKKPAEAINATKRDFLKKPDYANPFFWAPFVMYGAV